jgi:glycosyltransferase involved in cell wall biosynthesis
MRIAVFHELPRGGARRAINEYCGYLKKSNVVDLFIVDEVRNIAEDKFYSSVYFYKFSPKNWTGNDWKTRIYKDSIELIKLYSLNGKIAGEIDKNKYDIILVSASRYIEAPFITRFLTTPFVFYIHDPYYRIIYDSMLRVSKNLDFIRYNYERLNRLIRKILDKQNISRIKLCLVPSKFIGKLFTRTYGKNCKVVYYGVDTELFKPLSIKRDIDIFYIGSSAPIDGYTLVRQSIELMKFKPKTRILLSDKEWIADDKKLANLYQRSKVLLATAYNEGLGAVPLEAMACGVPVVATNEAGHKETVKDKVTGYLLERNAKIIAEKLDWLFSHPKDLKKIGDDARSVMIKEWSWDSRSQDLLNVLKEYINKKE